MAVKHNILGRGIIIGNSPISVGGFDVKVKFDNGMVKFCSWAELSLLD